MKKAILAGAVAMTMGLSANSAYAALASDANLAGSGSFAMEVSTGFFLPTAVTTLNGIDIGTAQAASGSHVGAPNGSESPNIDNPWAFFGNTGMHQTTSAVNIVSDDGAGNVLLDFSGWDVTWNGIPSIPMGAGAHTTTGGAANPEGQAILTCGNTCEEGDTFSLAYSGRVPDPDASSFAGVAYRFDLSGTVGSAAVPVPAAVWLFGSGLLGLVGVARRKKAA